MMVSSISRLLLRERRYNRSNSDFQTFFEEFIINSYHNLTEIYTGNSGIAPGIWNVLPFLIRDAKSCIDCEPHKG